MPQSPISFNLVNAAKKLVAGFADNFAAQLITESISNSYNITAAAVVKAVPGRLAKISVVVAGSTAGKVNDCATTGAIAAANQICAIPNTVGMIAMDWPCTAGITVTPGTGQTLAISYV